MPSRLVANGETHSSRMLHPTNINQNEVRVFKLEFRKTGSPNMSEFIATVGESSNGVSVWGEHYPGNEENIGLRVTGANASKGNYKRLVSAIETLYADLHNNTSVKYEGTRRRNSRCKNRRARFLKGVMMCVQSENSQPFTRSVASRRPGKGRLPGVMSCFREDPAERQQAVRSRSQPASQPVVR